MDGLAYVRALDADRPMPMAEHFAFRITALESGLVSATATPSTAHYNPFDVAQGGFAGTVLDIALGLVSISVLTGDATSVGTTDLSVRYLRPIFAATGTLAIHASVLHLGRSIVVAEATLKDAGGKLYASAQSNSLIVRTPPDAS